MVFVAPSSTLQLPTQGFDRRGPGNGLPPVSGLERRQTCALVFFSPAWQPCSPALFLALPSWAVTTSCGGGPGSERGTATVTCGYTGDAQTWTVPQGVTSASFDVQGAQGGNGGGNGGRAIDTLHLTPGTVVNVFVGGEGDNGGFNGGGSSGASVGGGASDIRIGGTALSDRVLIAGGEAAAPWPGSGGGGGGLTGEDGTIGGGGATGGAGGNQDGRAVAASSERWRRRQRWWWRRRLLGRRGRRDGRGRRRRRSGFGSADVTFTTGYLDRRRPGRDHVHRQRPCQQWRAGKRRQLHRRPQQQQLELASERSVGPCMRVRPATAKIQGCVGHII